MLGDDFLYALGTQNGGLGRKFANHDDEVALVVQQFGDRLTLELARHVSSEPT